MSIRERLVQLEADVDKVVLRPPREVRARGDRRRNAAAAISAVTVSTVVGAGAVTVATGVVGLPNSNGANPRSAFATSPCPEPSLGPTAGMMLALPHSKRVLVGLDPRTSDEQTAEVGERLRASSLVTAIHYVDDQEAWNIFFKGHCAEPEIVRLVDPYSLPNAYEVSLVDADDLAALEATLAGVPGVGMIWRLPE